MTDARPLRESIAKLVADGIVRHVNGVSSMRHNRFAIATVARQVSEEIETLLAVEEDEATPGAVVELRADLAGARPSVAAALWSYRRDQQARGADNEVLRALFQACRIADDATTRRLRNEAASESSAAEPAPAVGGAS